MKYIFYLILLYCTCITLPAKSQKTDVRNKVDSLLNRVTQAENDSLRIEFTFDLARAYYRLDKDSTTYLLKKTMTIARKSNKKTLLGLGYYIRGWYEKFNRLNNQSILSLDTAIQYLRAAKDTFHLAESLGDYGLATRNLNQFDKSIKAFNEVLSFENTEQLKQTKLGANINSASIYEDQNLPYKAEKRYKEALIFAKELEDEYGQIIIYGNLSSIYRHRKDFKQSIDCSHKSIELSQRIDVPSEYRRGLTNLGATYTQMRKIDSAQYYLLRAYQIGQKQDNGANNIKTAWHLAELYNSQNRLNMARKFAYISLQLAQKHKIPEDIVFGYDILFNIEKKAKKHALANQLADSLVFWKDSLNRSNNHKALADAEASYNNKLLQKENELKTAKIKTISVEKKYLQYLLLFGLFLACIMLYALWSFFKKKKIQSELAMEFEHTIKLTENVEAYRKKRATELHDDVGQDLLLAQQSMQLDNPKERTVQFVERALNKIRKISKDEYPYELNYVGLKTSLEYLIDIIKENTKLIISESLEDVPAQLPETQMLNIYRVVQEMLNNTIKNKTATTVFIGIEAKQNYLEIVYRDNGTGFEFEKKLYQEKSIGLKSITNRVRMLKAEIKNVPSVIENRYVIHVPFS